MYYSFNTYLLNRYSKSGSVLGSEDTAMNKKTPYLYGTYIIVILLPSFLNSVAQFISSNIYVRADSQVTYSHSR